MSHRLFALSGLLSVVLLGCTSAPTANNIPFSTTAERAFECAMGAARDTGFQIESSDGKSGIFSAVKMGSSNFSPSYQASFAIDKQLGAVQTNIQTFNQMYADQSAADKLTSEFQMAFSRRCAVQQTSLDGSATRTNSPPQQAPVIQAAESRSSALPASPMSLKDAQTNLNRLGFKVGTPDGLAGPKTVNALKAFQSGKGLVRSGQLDAATEQALRGR